MASSVLLESRPYRPFKSSEEYLEAMREDLAEWLNTMYPELMINADNFMDRLDTGVVLCKHANNVRQAAEDYLIRRQSRNKSMTRSMTSGLAGPILSMGNVHYLPAAKSGTFFARDNVSNFITWCRKALKIFECLLFETDDLIMRKNEKHVILCLLEVARLGAKFGMLAPMLIQMERQIDREIAADNKAAGLDFDMRAEFIKTMNSSEFDTDSEDEDDGKPMLIYGPQPQIITNDLKSLDEMVRDLVEKCTCPSQFPMVRVSEGKYRIGDTKVLIFVRILRSHVMVRVGGGWDTLSHYLDKHDPCRCRTQHRSSVAAKLIPRTNNQTNGIELHHAQVIFERSPPMSRKVLSNLPENATTSNNHLSPVNPNTLSSPTMYAKGRSRSPTPQRKLCNNIANSNDAAAQNYTAAEKSHRDLHNSSPIHTRYSSTLSPKKLADIKRKQHSTESNNGGQITETDLHVHFENKMSSTQQSHDNTNKSIPENLANNDGKFENISDSSSEISDEGYRSLGISNFANQSQKRETNQSLSKNDQSNGDLQNDSLNREQYNLNTSQQSITPVQEEHEKQPNQQQLSSSTVPKKLPFLNDKIIDIQQQANDFELSGICITDNEIKVDIASATGLRKTGFSDKIYGKANENDNGIGNIENTSPSKLAKNLSSKIPQKPFIMRRSSVDGSGGGDSRNDSILNSNLPVLSRKEIPMMNKNFSAKKVVAATLSKPTLKRDHDLGLLSQTNKGSNTWSERSMSTRKRPSITSETFASPSSNNFTRNSRARSSMVSYDKNGRRVRGGSTSLTTSPVKSKSNVTSPLKQQLLETAGKATNDAQILKKMKELLIQYSDFMNNVPNNDECDGNGKSPCDDDFTTAWVRNNGTLNRSNTCSSPIVGRSKRSSAASSVDSTYSKDNNSMVVVSSRKDRGLSRIPGPVRNHTELY